MCDDNDDRMDVINFKTGPFFNNVMCFYLFNANIYNFDKKRSLKNIYKIVYSDFKKPLLQI